MTRTWIAIAAALCLNASVASAQVTHLTVNTATAAVYKAPTTVSPVIGQAPRGTTLDVTRDVGDWVKVAWSASPDGIGYVRKSTGTMSVPGSAVSATRAATTPAAPASPAAPAAPALPVSPVSSAASTGQAAPAATPRPTSAQVGPVVRPQPAAVPAAYVRPSHRFGVGGQIGGAAVGGGFSARGWTAGQRLGYQFEVMRYSMSNPVFFTQMTSTQVGPKVLYAFRDRVSDRTWLRPYAGAGAHVVRATMTDPVTGTSMSDARLAAQLFGGTELTLSNVPRLGLSADVGYQWYQNQFAGYSLEGMTVAVTAHWYLK